MYYNILEIFATILALSFPPLVALGLSLLLRLLLKKTLKMILKKEPATVTLNSLSIVLGIGTILILLFTTRY